MAKYDKEGREIPDPKPVEVPLGMRRPPDIHELIARYVRTEAFRQKAMAEGFESEEEANDFEVEDVDREDEMSAAERAFIMSEEFPATKAEVDAAAQAVREARRARLEGGGATPPKATPGAKDQEAPQEE